jgi:hypothetical protein
MSYPAAGLPPTSAPGALRASTWRRAEMVLKPPALGETDSTTESAAWPPTGGSGATVATLAAFRATRAAVSASERGASRTSGAIAPAGKCAPKSCSPAMLPGCPLRSFRGSLLIRSDISPGQARPSTRTAPTATAAARRGTRAPMAAHARGRQTLCDACPVCQIISCYSCHSGQIRWWLHRPCGANVLVF